MKYRILWIAVLALILTGTPAQAEEVAEENASDASDLTEVAPIVCQTEPMKGKEGAEIVCWQEGQGQGQPAANPCDGILGFPGQGIVIKSCVANCQACSIPPGRVAAIDAAIQRTCDQICATGDCPPGKDCVRDQLVNHTDVPTCIQASKACQAPTPDFCLKIERVAECTCKCS